MFKNKYIKQLQDVQTQIKNCKASIAKLKAPTTSYSKAYQLSSYLISVMNGSADCESLLKSSYLLKDGDVFNYLEELGHYFINIAQYQKEKQMYEAELNQLRQKERELKAALGID